jgi:hypothetical protein
MTSTDCNQKLHVCFNYTQSAIDYFAMMTWASMRKCGQFVYRQLEVDQLIAFVRQSSCVQRVSQKPQIIQPVIDESKINDLNLTIQALEERIKQLETAHVPKNAMVSHDHKRKIDKKQKGLLQQILFDNKKLKRSSKKLSSEKT